MFTLLTLFAMLTPTNPNAGGSAFRPPPPLETVLAGKKWERRVLLLYARLPNSVPLVTQQRLLTDQRAGLAERDIDVITVLDADLTAADRTYLRGGDRRLPANAEFAGFLIGKDGGVKQRFTRPTAPQTLFRVIDAMPMRQTEMRRN